MDTALGRLLSVAGACLLVSVLVAFSSGNSPGHHFADQGDEAVAGLRTWRRHNCAACHSIYGLGGHLGPDLTNVISRRGRSYVEYVIKNGATENGAGKMPPFELSDGEAEELVSYLEALNGYGEYPLKSFSRGPFGHNLTGQDE